MAYFPKKDSQKPEVAETPIWKCSDPACRGWMRVEFAFAEHPQCPFCGTGMVQSTKAVPQLQPYPAKGGTL